MKHTATSEDKIWQYIPQRPPMVMIDEILVSDEEKTITGLKVRADNIFVQEGTFSAPGLMENMAQTAAARAGYEFVNKNEEVKLGFIGGIKHLRIHRRPPVGAVLETEIRKLSKVFNISAAKAEVYQNGELIAECEMKIFIRE